MHRLVDGREVLCGGSDCHRGGGEDLTSQGAQDSARGDPGNAPWTPEGGLSNTVASAPVRVAPGAPPIAQPPAPSPNKPVVVPTVAPI